MNNVQVLRKVETLCNNNEFVANITNLKLPNFDFSEAMIDNIERILNTPWQHREEPDVLDLLSCLRAFPLIKNFEAKLSVEERILLSFNLKIVRHEPYDPVCKIKDPSNCVFFLLEGKIAITLTNAKVYKPEILEGTVIAYYNPGTAFGEVGILTNTSRTASCVPVTLSRVMILSKGAFKAFLGDKMIYERKTNFQFISSVRLFEGWPQQNIHGILTHIKVLKPEHNMFIYKRDDVDSNIYIVYKGEVQLLAEIEVEISTDIEKSHLMKKPPLKATNIRSVIKLSEGSYFGDEDGLESTVKSCWALSSTPDTLLFMITKEKLKLNITMEPETIHRYKLMVEKSEQRAEQMKQAIKNLKQVLTAAVNNGLNANEMRLNQNSLHQVALVQKLELGLAPSTQPPKSSTAKYPEIALAVMIQNMESSLSRKVELEAIIREQERQNGVPKFDFESIASEVFLAGSKPKKQKDHKRKLEDRSRQEKEFVKRLEECLSTGTRFKAKEDTPAVGKTNFLTFALNRVKSTFEAENVKNRTNYSLLLTSRSEEIGAALDQQRRARSDHVSVDEYNSSNSRRAHSVDEGYEDRMTQVLRKKYKLELQRLAGTRRTAKDSKIKIDPLLQMEDSVDTTSKIFKTEPRSVSFRPDSKRKTGQSVSEQVEGAQQLKVIMTRRVLLREGPSKAPSKESATDRVHPLDATLSTLQKAVTAKDKFSRLERKPLLLETAHPSRITSLRQIGENSLVLPRIPKAASNAEIVRRLSQQAAMTITKFES